MKASHFNPGPRGKREGREGGRGGRDYYICYTGMYHSTKCGVFLSLSLGQDLQISVSVWNRVYVQTLELGQLSSARITLQTNKHCSHSSPDASSLKHTISNCFCSGMGIYFHHFVWQGQVPTLSAAYAHTKSKLKDGGKGNHRQK